MGVDLQGCCGTVAANFADRTEAVPIPADQNMVSTVAVGVLRSSEQMDFARQFVAMLLSPEGQAIFAKHHYTTSLPPTLADEASVRAAPEGGGS